ncbi:hypothetical protein ACFV4M_40670 [Kitasatospora indigofera]|uniref:glycoside hydrolase family 16 protein n=1 Tax=Kitasatospora indigofera TaxID=67307 RepID=UPI003663C546
MIGKHSLTVIARAATATAGALVLALAALPGQAAVAAPVVLQLRLTPTGATAGAEVSATLTVLSSRCQTVRSLGVGVRDSAGHNLDFPGTASDVRICPTGVTFTTRARAFPAGTYTQFGFYRDASGYHNLTGTTLTVRPAAVPAVPAVPSVPAVPATAPPLGGRSPVFLEEFSHPLDWGAAWVGTRTSAYEYGDHNPKDNKLDQLTQDAVTVADGAATFTARPGSRVLENGLRSWTTGLLTTEGSAQGFKVRTGDYIETRVQLPARTGAWPALWTWKEGGNEVDVFEYHPDHPDLLELTNHVRSGSADYSNPRAVAPGGWVTIGVLCGVGSDDWYVNNTKVYSDRTGVGSQWSAYLILNLSVSAGRYHPAPDSTKPITFAADYVRVWR